MPAISAEDFISDELRDAMRRRVHEIIGIALLGVAGIAALALATWSVQDPSFSHATNAPVHNMLGIVGAASADLMMQILRHRHSCAAVSGVRMGLAPAHAPPA